jgi:uncharacterized protein (DUF1697 family)
MNAQKKLGIEDVSTLLNGGSVIFNWNRELSAIVLEKKLGKLETF